MVVQSSDAAASKTESYFEAARRRGIRLIANGDFLDEERLDDSGRALVLSEIFARNVRSAEIKALAEHLAPILDRVATAQAGSGLIYGPTGAGKTVSAIHVLSTLKAMAKREHVFFDYFYIDCLGRTTCFAALNRIAVALDASRSYGKGVPTDWIIARIRDSLKARRGTCLFVFDEIDNISTERSFLMNFLIKSLPRMVPVRLAYLFLTNDSSWEHSLDARTLSCFRKNDFIFSPYNASEILEILNLRVEKALVTERVDDGALSLIAAYAARDSGDARKAVALLAKSASIADRRGERLTTTIVEEAEAILETEKTVAIAQALPLQQQLTLIACYTLLLNRKTRVCSRDVYDFYAKIAKEFGVRALSQRRISDALSSLDLYALIDARLVSRGRYGKTRLIGLASNQDLAQQTLQHLQKVVGCR